MKDEVKVGLFALAGIATLAFSLILLADFSIGKRYRIYVTFDDISGLASKSPVRLNGVEVGKIKSVSFDGKKVVAEVLVDEKVKIARDSKFYIASTSIVGSKFLQINQGDLSLGYLRPGERVDAITRKPIEEVVLEMAEKINSLANQLTSKGEIAKNLSEAAKNLRDITANLNSLISRNSTSIDSLIKNADETLSKIKEFSIKIENIIDRIQSSEGAIGTLLNDKTTQENVKQTIENIKDATKSLKEYTSKTSKVKTYWKWEFKYEPSSKQSYNDVGLRINVNENKYYYVGASNIISMKNKPRGTSYEPHNTLDAYLGWNYDRWGFYVGAIRGTGGFGVKYRITGNEAEKNSLWFEAEANEFSRNRVVKSRYFNDARYDASVRYYLKPGISTSLKLTDILEVKRISVTTKIVFEDKDITTILGLTGGSSAAALIAK
ncbi:MAG: MlaD family protein [Elusimicrobiales bacterium]